MLIAESAVSQTPTVVNEDERWKPTIAGLPLLGEISSEEHPEPMQPGLLFRIDRVAGQRRPRRLPRIATPENQVTAGFAELLAVVPKLPPGRLWSDLTSAERRAIRGPAVKRSNDTPALDTRGERPSTRPESECSQTAEARRYRRKRTASRERRIALFDQQPNCFDCGGVLTLVHDRAVPDGRACMVTREGAKVLICKGCHRLELDGSK